MLLLVDITERDVEFTKLVCLSVEPSWGVQTTYDSLHGIKRRLDASDACFPSRPTWLLFGTDSILLVPVRLSIALISPIVLETYGHSNERVCEMKTRLWAGLGWFPLCFDSFMLPVSSSSDASV